MPAYRRRTLTAWLLLLLIEVCGGGAVQAADKVSVTVLVKDSLAAPRQEATIEAKVTAKGWLHDGPVGGEPLELVINGTVTATGMSGGDGRARLSWTTTGKSVIPIQVRIGASPRVSTAQGEGNLIVWERRTPVLVVELASLMEDVAGNAPLPGLASGIQQEPKPMADAADELAKLSQFYYGIMYVASMPAGADGFVTSHQARNWLATHKFPRGFVLALPSGEDALGAKIDELHEAGWKTIRTGIGRSKAFVETFLRRRLEAIMMIDPASDEVPRKAKVAKDWKEVRKKL
ncbi:MAG TPA: hypothetical protein VJL88_01595 [Nitrospira sp.]|nr:hypothetical protein [Nitrospira sp.]